MQVGLTLAGKFQDFGGLVQHARVWLAWCAMVVMTFSNMPASIAAETMRFGGFVDTKWVKALSVTDVAEPLEKLRRRL